VDALLNVQEAKADLNTLKESITGYSYTTAAKQIIVTAALTRILVRNVTSDRLLFQSGCFS
jgi:hypothetical protein